MSIKQHLDLLGRKVEDKVSSFSGIVTSVSFDLYGCIQALVNPGMDRDGKLRDSHWFDANRLRVMAPDRAMEPPDFDHDPSKIAQGQKGPADRPLPGKC